MMVFQMIQKLTYEELADKVRALEKVEEALLQSEAKYRQLFECMAQGAFYQRADGMLVDVNLAALEMLGLTRDQFLGRTSLDPKWKVIQKNGADLPGDQHPSMVALQTGQAIRNKIVGVLHPIKNDYVWVNINAIPQFRVGEEKPYQVFVTMHDITERIQTEKELLQSETRNRTLLNSIPDLIWLKDPNGVYLNCNPTFERFFGATESTIIGKTDYDFVDKDLADFFRTHDRKAMEADRPSINEEWLTFAEDGYQGLFETIKTPMKDSAGNLIGVLGIARDISAHKRSEAALKENELRYKSAQRIGRVGNWEYNLVTETFWGSDEARRIYGFDPDSQEFTTDEVENCIPERELVHQALIDLIEKGQPYNLEFEIHPITGAPSKVIKSIAGVVKDDSGAPVKVLGVIQDITDQKTAEKEKALLERQLQQAQKMESIGNLAGGIAHDFNNILSSIIGFTELSLDDVAKGSIIEDNLQEIYSAGKRAKDLVKQILAFARQSDEEIKPIQVDTIIQEALKLIRSSIPTTITVKQDLQSDSLIMGNPTQVHQIIMNLCTNAAQAMENKGGILGVTLKDILLAKENICGLPDGHYMEIQLSDTGEGIDPEIMASIFEPYFTTKNPGEGTGMGLAMVKGIVESYGGKITAESKKGAGTVFTIYLPITRKRRLQNPYLPETLPRGREHILFVDDEPPLARMGRKILERLGYTVTARTSSVEALELFRSRPDDFHLIITDMTMPNMTGDQLAIEMMKIRKDIPVIICSGYSKKVSDETAFLIGIKAFIYKPVVKADLAKTVRKVIDDTLKPDIGSV